MKSKYSIEKSVKYLTNFLNTYPKQRGYKLYTRETYIKDILYGLGASLSEDYSWTDGFDKFQKEVLLPLILKNLRLNKDELLNIYRNMQ